MSKKHIFDVYKTLKMSRKYKFGEALGAYFISFATVN